MSSAEQQDGCVNLCTATAAEVGTSVDLTGVCDYAASEPILGVDVTACHIESVEFQVIDNDLVLMSVRTQVDFDFTTGGLDGNILRASAFCESVIQSLMPAAEGRHFFQPHPCSADLTCSARDAGFDPDTGLQSFTVTVTGTTSCVECSPEVVDVKRCTAQ